VSEVEVWAESEREPLAAPEKQQTDANIRDGASERLYARTIGLRGLRSLKRFTRYDVSDWACSRRSSSCW
jgi:hypothetical protein